MHQYTATESTHSGTYRRVHMYHVGKAKTEDDTRQKKETHISSRHEKHIIQTTRQAIVAGIAVSYISRVRTEISSDQFVS